MCHSVSSLKPSTPVLGVEIGAARKAYPLTPAKKRACVRDTIGGKPIAVFWYGKTESAVAFDTEVDGKQLTFYADRISPETAPFKDLD